MSKSSRIAESQKKVSGELFTLTYGSLVAQLLEDYESDEEVNKQLLQIGRNIGIRLIEDFLARNPTIGRCNDLKEVADVIAEVGFKTFIGVKAKVGNWSLDGSEFTLILDQNPLADFVELPPSHRDLNYSNIIAGVIKGALASVQLDTEVTFVRDQLKGDSTTDLRVKYISRLFDDIPAGDDD